MPATTAIPVVSNTVTSTSYAQIASPDPTKSSEIIEINSPRSTIIMGASAEDPSGKEESNSSDKNKNNKAGASSGQKKKNESSRKKGNNNREPTTATGAVSPNQSSGGGYHQVIPPHGTPQQQSNYYGAYNNSQVTPESPSPSTGGNGRQTVYDGTSFFQQQTAAAAAGFHNNSPFTTAGAAHQYAGGNSSSQQPPNSPTQSMSGIPPASPLFPRMTGGHMQAFMNSNSSRGGGGDSGGANPVMSPVQSGYVPSSGMYVPGNAYPIIAGRPNGSPNNNAGSGNNANEEFVTWNENRNISYTLSPGQGMPYVPGMPQRPDRSTSFDDSSLPPLGPDSVQQPPHAYGAGPGGGPPQGWGYGGPPPDGSQGRSAVPYIGQPGGPQFRHPSQFGNPYGGNFGYAATSSPGPPIQTTSSNKGPEGANLFIFHIPNHFTNLDMYQLFCPYGNLLSVRIMVEKDSGRSRGFGFVSYDYPDAAQLAIKELNGFAIGNKRLKVQHKQLQPEERNQGGGANFNGGESGHSSSPHHGGGGGRGGGGGQGAFGDRGGSNLPPSGPMAVSTGWYNENDDRIPSGSSPSAPQNHSSGDVASGGDQHHVVVVVGDDPNSPNVTAAAVVTSAGGGGTTVNTTTTTAGSDEQQPGNNDPLSSMEPLRQTLPDIGSVATTAVPGEN